MYNFKIRINIKSTNGSDHTYQKDFVGNPYQFMGQDIRFPNYTLDFEYAHEDTSYYQADLNEEQLADFLFFVIKEEWTCLVT